MLLVRGDQPVPVDVLTGTLWGDRPDPRAGQKPQLHVHRLRGVALNELAATHAATGDQARALRLYHEALVENGQVHRHEYAHALAGIGDVHAGLGEHDQAYEYWQGALAAYRELGMPHAEDMSARLDRLGSPVES